ncbi:MAG: threonylcarbamoyl-AMP synthase [Magnetococcales bacterium]|nr:threonylcarbamoyl-AMP synthase [Magnetococcales bacterium]
MDNALIQQAVTALTRGAVIAYPTETIYGLGVDPFQPKALQRLLDLKERRSDKGLILLVSGKAMASELIKEMTPSAERLMESFWPGPLTLVLPARHHLSKIITGQPWQGQRWVAIRHSPSETVSTLMKLWNKPLVSTSANRSKEPVARSAKQIESLWGSQLGCIIPGEVNRQNQPSTVVRLQDDQMTILRTGVIPDEKITACLRATEEIKYSD